MADILCPECDFSIIPEYMSTCGCQDVSTESIEYEDFWAIDSQERLNTDSLGYLTKE